MFFVLINELSHHLNFKLIHYPEEKNFGYWNKSEAKWTGLLEKLNSRSIDVIASEVTMTKERRKAFDFACPLFLSKGQLFIKDPGTGFVGWDAYFKVCKIFLITIIYLV